MGRNADHLCARCRQRPVEDFGDGEASFQCGPCNDRDIERSNERREWDYYHAERGDHLPSPTKEGPVT